MTSAVSLYPNPATGLRINRGTKTPRNLRLSEGCRFSLGRGVYDATAPAEPLGAAHPFPLWGLSACR